MVRSRTQSKNELQTFLDSEYESRLDRISRGIPHLDSRLHDNHLVSAKLSPNSKLENWCGDTVAVMICIGEMNLGTVCQCLILNSQWSDCWFLNQSNQTWYHNVLTLVV